jgi:hypothetical protein
MTLSEYLTSGQIVSENGTYYVKRLDESLVFIGEVGKECALQEYLETVPQAVEWLSR